MDIWLCLAATIVAAVQSILAREDSKICEDPSYSCGPLPPVLPSNYVLKYESIDLVQNQTYWVEEYFDRTNLRAKVVLITQGDEVFFLYDYHAETVTTFTTKRPGARIRWDPESQYTCETVRMASFIPQGLPFGYKYRNERPVGSRMDDVYEALKFGGPYRTHFLNSHKSEETRGIATNVFESCAYNSDEDSIYRMRYYWAANTSFVFPSGEREVPVRIEQIGNVPSVDGDASRTSQHIIKNVAWYEQNPKFTEDTFQIPQTMDCGYSAKERDFPDLPFSFSFRVEQVSYAIDKNGSLIGDSAKVSFKEIWYDNLNRLARVDMIPTDEEKDWPMIKETGNVNYPLSIVIDFTYGAAFITHTSNGECVVKKLDANFFLCYATTVSSIEMVNSASLFGVTQPHQYKGKYTVRGLEVDTWVLTTNSASSLSQIEKRTHELSIVSNERVLRFGEGVTRFVPVQESTYEYAADNSDGETSVRQNVTTKNYFKFSGIQPRLSVFEAPGCMQHHGSRMFTLCFEGASKDVINDNKLAFVETLRKAVRDYGDVGTVLRIQDVDVHYDRKTQQMRSFFRILAPLPELQQEVVRSIEDSKAALLKEVNKGTFFVSIPIAEKDGSSKVKSFQAIKNSLEEFGDTTPSTKNYYHPRKVMGAMVAEQMAPVKDIILGYNPGVFAAIQVVFMLAGILCGILSMRLYIMKKTTPNLVEQDQSMELS